MSGRHITVFSAASLSALVLAGASTLTAAQSCEKLASLKLAHTIITSAVTVPAGPFTPPSAPPGTAALVDLPKFCRVSGVIAPTTDSEIKFEVWLPVAGWNGNFQQVGNGGFAGSIVYPALGRALQDRYASASTDDGHAGSGTDGSWALGHPEKLIDFGYRAVHETASKAKEIVQAFYGTAPRRSYFNGCSDGGREALMEAQRFPEDFIGILAGAPANFWSHALAGAILIQKALLDNPASYIPVSKLPAIESAALAACDALDGVKDGVIADPRRCHFDPAVIECKGADGPGCLTPQQVETLKTIYAGPKNPRTGQQIYPGFEPGAEVGPGMWSRWIIGTGSNEKPLELSFGIGTFAYMVFENPNWDFHTLNFDTDAQLAEEKLGPILDSTNANLGPFRARGGKLIHYHGWVDPALPPRASIDYYDTVVAKMRDTAPQGQGANALTETQKFYRLFMVPGMGHCGGGPGPNSFGRTGATSLRVKKGDAEHDALTALEQWVEHGVAPEKVIATKYTNDNPMDGVAMTRPLCPYPAEAQWSGKGSTNDAANFACKLPSNK
jgi:tannase/feruloyl esterase